MKKVNAILFVFIVLFALAVNSNAQISVPGKPLSDYNTLNSNIPTVNMPAFNVDKLLQEDNFESQFKDIPPRFGNPMTVDYGYPSTGIIETLSDGSKVWRMAIKSAGAVSINLIFDRFYMPKGATFFIYSKDKSTVFGAYTDQNNNTEKVFSTTPVFGDEIILEYNAPYYVKEQPEIHLSTVVHAYKNILNYLKKIKDYGTSGSCNRNVICPDGDPYRNQIRAVGMIIIGGTRWCSGSLLNNTRNDGTPFFMTANHCYSGTPSTWVFMFKYEAPTCPNPGGDGPLTYTISGSTLLARNAFSDFCLVKLSSKPPVSYNVYYTGWSRSNVPATGGFAIHHPDGDVKKLSMANLPYTPTSYNNPSIPGDSSHWHVTWTVMPGTGQIAITEPGSSGSPVYDQNKRFVGQLHGGPSSCTASDKSDYYGKFDRSWNYGSTPDTRAKDWLDSANTGVMFIDGFDPNAGPLNAFNLVNPAAGVTITAIAGSSTPITFDWDTSTAAATYSWIFGSALPTRLLSIPVSPKPFILTLGQLDAYLAGIGIAQGDSISGSWDVWAYRNNAPINDSLKATNGPRTIKFKRYKPALTAFSLLSPVNNSRLETMPGGTSPINSIWTKSGAGAKYKWFYATPNFNSPANIKLAILSDNTGYDSVLTVTNGTLDQLLSTFVNPGDSTIGQWRVYAYSGTDSLASSQTFGITMKRLPIGNFVIGSGTAALTFPYSTYWHDGRTQLVYTKGEILAAGGNGNQITQIGFNVTVAASQVMNGFTVKMANYVDSNISGGFVTSANWSTVYSGTYTVPGTGWQYIVLQTPFGYDRAKNLLIEICFDNSSFTSNTTVLGSPGEANYQYNRHVDNAAGCSLTTGTAYTGGRPNITLVMNMAMNNGNNHESIPTRYDLAQNYPNPFNPVTKIKYALPLAGNVSIKIYDVLGKEVITLVNEYKKEGVYMVDFNAGNLASGIYFYKLESNGFVDTKKMILMK